MSKSAIKKHGNCGKTNRRIYDKPMVKVGVRIQDDHHLKIIIENGVTFSEKLRTALGRLYDAK